MEVRRVLEVFVLIATSLASAVRITTFRIPIGESHEALLDCRYDLEGRQLYDAKWYKDNKEIYRCLPDGKVNEYPIEDQGFSIYRSGPALLGSCKLWLTGLTKSSAGEYKCEVTAEGPSFKNDFKSGEFKFVEWAPRLGNTSHQDLEKEINAVSHSAPAQCKFFVLDFIKATIVPFLYYLLLQII